MAQAVSSRSLTAEARVRTWGGHAGFVVGIVALKQVFLRVLQSSLAISFHDHSPCSYIARGINSIHPSKGATAQIGPWPPLLRFHNNNVLRCEVVSLTTNPR
jgi:hypothetical protein